MDEFFKETDVQLAHIIATKPKERAKEQLLGRMKPVLERKTDEALTELHIDENQYQRDPINSETVEILSGAKNDKERLVNQYILLKKSVIERKPNDKRSIDEITFLVDLEDLERLKKAVKKKDPTQLAADVSKLAAEAKEAASKPKIPSRKVYVGIAWNMLGTMCQTMERLSQPLDHLLHKKYPAIGLTVRMDGYKDRIDENEGDIKECLDEIIEENEEALAEYLTPYHRLAMIMGSAAVTTVTANNAYGAPALPPVPGVAPAQGPHQNTDPVVTRPAEATERKPAIDNRPHPISNVNPASEHKHVVSLVESEPNSGEEDVGREEGGYWTS